MKTRKLILWTLLALGLAWSGYGQVTNQVFTNSVGAPVPDDNPIGLPSTVAVSGMSGTITNVDVSLTISGGYNGDLYAYLSYNNQVAVLLNRVGLSSTNAFGYGDAGFSITLSDSAAADIHWYGGNGGAQLSGTWQPDGRAIIPSSPGAAFETAPQSLMLSGFQGQDPNGTWTLFIADLTSGNQSTLVGWSLDITTVPEPGSTALFGLGLACLAGCVLRSRLASRKE